MTEAILLAFLIFAAALLYSSVGHGGASGYLAAMALFGLAPEAMKPAALTLNIFVATIGTIRFSRAGCFSWRLFLPFAATSIPFAFIGGAMKISGSLYKQILGAALLIAAANLFWQSYRGARTGREFARVAPPPVAVAALLGAGLGLLSGMTGVGGGIFLSPLLLLMNWADPKRTAGVSAAFILVNSIAGLAGHIASLQLLPRELPFWIVAAVGGGLIGSGMGARKLANPAIRALLAIVLVVAGAKMILA